MSGINFNKDIASLSLKEVSNSVKPEKEVATANVTNESVLEIDIKDTTKIETSSKSSVQPIAIPQAEEDDEPSGIMGIFYRRDDY